MRKNYFAKKFVAYSMAFAVAFSTLTVSPVFVKEAKAVTFTETLTATGGSTLSNSGFVAAEDHFIMNSLTKDSVTAITTTPNYTQMEEILGTTETYLYNDVTVTAIPNSTIDGTNSPKYKMTISTPDAGKTSKKSVLASSVETAANSQQLKDADVTEPGTLADPVVTTVAATNKLVILDGVQNKNISIRGLETAANSGTYKWYKLMPVTKTFDWTNDNNGTSKLTFTGFKLVDIDSFTGTAVTSTTASHNFPKVTEDDLGLYICVNTTGKKLVSFVNLCEKSTLDAKSVKDEVFAKVGSKAKLTVETTGTKSKTYTWTKGAKTLTTPTENPNEYVIDSVTEDDFGKYKCTVADGTTQKEVEIRLSQLTQDEVATANATNKATTVNTNVFDAINSSSKFPSGKYTLTTSLPSGDYYYVWELTSYDTTTSGYVSKLAPISSSDKLSYSVSNKAITVALKDTEVQSAKCYAIPKSVYNINETIKTDLEEIAKTTNDVDKASAIDNLRTHEYSLRTNAAYIEDFTFVTTNNKPTTLPTEVKIVKMGDTVTLEAPTAIENKGTAVSYSWENVSGGQYTVVDDTSNKLTITNVDQKDLGTITCTIKYCTAGCADLATHVKNNCSHESIPSGSGDLHRVKQFNLISESDLSVTASDVQVRAGQKAELTVNATSSLPLSYKWYKQKGDKIVKGTVGSETEYKTDGTNGGLSTFELAADATTHALKLTNVGAGNYYVATSPNPYTYLCVVTDGINTVKTVVKVMQVDTFKVYKDENALYLGKILDGIKDSDGVTADLNELKLYYGGLKGDSITLAPIVVANPEIEKDITYTWKKDGIAYSTDKAITVSCDGNAATYQLTITEGTSPIELEYNVKTLTDKQLETATITGGNVYVKSNNIYTGKEINPVNKVSVDVFDGTNYYTYTLKENTDYTVSLTDAINAGVSKYEVVLVGKFADAYGKLTDKQKDDYKFRGIFTITRADNKVEIADNTVVLGKSVLPKTVTNLGKGALTYTYYADAAATTEIAAPTKVGTYYVKATTAATMNYSEAESNVAKVVVAPGKPAIGSTSRTASSITLNWAKTTGATAYRVYIKKNGKFTKVANTTGLKYTVTGLASATTYEFAVKAFVNGVASPVYSVRTTTTAPAKVATPAVTAKGSGKVAVSYSKVTRATGYQVYMAKGNGSYKKVAQGKLTAITKSKLTKGATYKFKVRAYKTVGSNVYYGAFSSAKAVKVK